MELERQQKYVNTVKPPKKSTFCTNLKTYFKEYTESTGIHGVRYLTEPRSLFEKIFWFSVLCGSVGGCFFMIYEIIEKYQNSPVVVTFATQDTPLFEIPFPGVTICPESKCLEEKFNYSEVFNKLYRTSKIDNYTEIRYFYYVSLLCNVDEQFHLNSYDANIESDFFDIINELKPDEIIKCSYMGENCTESLTPLLTDQGICFSFNIVDRKDMFRQKIFRYKDFQQVSSEALGYNADSGYPQNADIDTYPERALMSGADNSLTLQFAHVRYNTDLLCNTYQQGFRVLLHNPLEYPRLSKFYFHVPLEKTVVAAVEPNLIITSDAVKHFRPSIRNCFLENERPLFYFKIYTQSNCLFECETNRTLKKCGCVTYYMPRINETKICGIQDQKCVMDALKELKISELKTKISGITDDYDCGCRPSCTSLTYNVDTTLSDYFIKEFMEMEHPENATSLERVRFSVLSVYFKDDQFIPIERNELYGVSDFISNFGGLLVLFTGFSLISCVEIIYFAVIRIFFNKKLYGTWFGSAAS